MPSTRYERPDPFVLTPKESLQEALAKVAKCGSQMGVETYDKDRRVYCYCNSCGESLLILDYRDVLIIPDYEFVRYLIRQNASQKAERQERVKKLLAEPQKAPVASQVSVPQKSVQELQAENERLLERLSLLEDRLARGGYRD